MRSDRLAPACHVDADPPLQPERSDFATVGAQFLVIPSGKVYYEVEVLRAKGCVKVGFGSSEVLDSASGPPLAADAGYAQYLQATLRAGDRVVGVAGDRKGAVGVFVGGVQSTPPCSVRWEPDGRLHPVFWKDIEIDSGSADVRYGVHRSVQLGTPCYLAACLSVLAAATSA
jgi:hypothetical protein